MRHILTLLLLLVAGLLPAAPAAAQSDRLCFPETGYCISGAIRAYWERNGGLPIFGYPISDVAIESVQNDDTSIGWQGPVQWFERDRLEDHSAEGLGVLAGRLGAEQLRNLTLSLVVPRPEPVAGAAPGCRYFPETSHSICEPFLSYWERNGGLERFGYPLSEPFELTVGAWSGTVQYFERRRMELHRRFPPGADEVLLGLLARELHDGVPSAVCPGGVPAELQRSLDSVAFKFQLGCPLAIQTDMPLAQQPFERGVMVWVAGTDLARQSPAIYVVRTTPQPLAYTRYPDTAAEGGPVPPPESPPPGLYEPIRGFGKVWREQPGVRESLGWAVAPERGDSGVFIPYSSGGAIVWFQSDDFVYFFAPNGQVTAFRRHQ